jgi:hypothetical protein
MVASRPLRPSSGRIRPRPGSQGSKCHPMPLQLARVKGPGEPVPPPGSRRWQPKPPEMKATIVPRGPIRSAATQQAGPVLTEWTCQTDLPHWAGQGPERLVLASAALRDNRRSREFLPKHLAAWRGAPRSRQLPACRWRSVFDFAALKASVWHVRQRRGKNRVILEVGARVRPCSDPLTEPHTCCEGFF